RCCPSSAMPANRICREYLSSIGKALHLPLNSVVDRIHQRLGFDCHCLSNSCIEFLRVRRIEEEPRKATVAKTNLCRNQRNCKVAELERPDIGNPRENECGTFDWMDFGNALGRQPGQEIID